MEVGSPDHRSSISNTIRSALKDNPEVSPVLAEADFIVECMINEHIYSPQDLIFLARAGVFSNERCEALLDSKCSDSAKTVLQRYEGRTFCKDQN